MEQCPRCGRYLRFKLVYNCGTPVVGYDCVCGYDSFKNRNTVATNTTTVTTNTTNPLVYWFNTSSIEEYKNEK